MEAAPHGSQKPAAFKYRGRDDECPAEHPAKRKKCGGDREDNRRGDGERRRGDLGNHRDDECEERSSSANDYGASNVKQENDATYPEQAFPCTFEGRADSGRFLAFEVGY